MSSNQETCIRCTRCGTRSPLSALVCPECGYDLGQFGIRESGTVRNAAPKKTPEKKPLPRFLPMIGGAVLLMLALAAFPVLVPDKPEAASSPAPTAATIPATTVPEETIRVYTPQERMLAQNFSEICRENIGGQSIDIQTITFLDSTENAPESAWDVSMANNQVVLAWVGNASELYVAAPDGVVAPEESQYLFGSRDDSHVFAGVSRICFGSNFDTAHVKNMKGMFQSCAALTELDLDAFDTGNVVDMSNMFCECKNLTSLDLKSFDTASVTDMSYMFGHMEALTELDLSGFDTSAVTNMYGMFDSCSQLTELDLSNYDTSCVTEMVGMFQFCYSLTDLDVSSFDTGNVTDMRFMFSCCKNLKELDLSGFDASNAQVYRMLYNCPAGYIWGSLFPSSVANY